MYRYRYPDSPDQISVVQNLYFYQSQQLFIMEIWESDEVYIKKAPFNL